MRTIKFRARCWEDGKFHYGDLVQMQSTAYIHETVNGFRKAYEVDIRTIGEYTGLDDENGQAIYEGTVLRVYNTKTKDLEVGVVVMSGLGVWSIKIGNLKVPILEFIDNTLSLVHDMSRIEVIG